MSEQWRAVPGYEGSYEVSDHGSVRSLNRVTHDGKHLHGQAIRPYRMPTGHIRVALGKFGKKKTLKVHRLVLLAFIGPAETGMECLHIDGNPSNNYVENLQWGTKSENVKDQIRHGVHVEARKEACPQGHPYNAENTYRRSKSNYRQCRTCVLAQQRNAYAERQLGRAAS